MACARARAALSLSLLVVASAAKREAGCASAFQQCGGPHFGGPTCCEKGCSCSDQAGGGVYSQCVPPVGEFLCGGSGPAPTPAAPAPTPEVPALTLEAPAPTPEAPPAPTPEAPAPTPEEEEPTVLTAFDCDADDESEQLTWSAKQKDWCCTHEKNGCAHEKKAKASSTSSSPEKKSAANVDGDDDASESFCCVAGTGSCGGCPKESRISSQAFCGESRESCESCTQGARWCADSSSEIDIVRKFSLRDASPNGNARWPAFGSGSHALSLCMVLVLAASALAAAVYRARVRPYGRVEAAGTVGES